MQCCTSFFINVDNVINLATQIDTLRQYLSTPFVTIYLSSVLNSISNVQNHPTLATQVNADK